MSAGAAVLTALCLSQGAPRPSSMALRNTYEANRGALVQVVGPHQQGPGIVIGNDGQVLTSVQFVGLESARVRLGAQTLPARVVMANAGIQAAVVKVLAPPSAQPPATVAAKLDARLAKGDWLVGLTQDRSGKVTPRLEQVIALPTERSPFFRVAPAVAPGSPVFDPRGRLVGMAVDRSGHALPLSEVKAHLTAALP